VLSGVSCACVWCACVNASMSVTHTHTHTHRTILVEHPRLQHTAMHCNSPPEHPPFAYAAEHMPERHQTIMFIHVRDASFSKGTKKIGTRGPGLCASLQHVFRCKLFRPGYHETFVSMQHAAKCVSLQHTATHTPDVCVTATHFNTPNWPRSHETCECGERL